MKRVQCYDADKQRNHNPDDYLFFHKRAMWPNGELTDAAEPHSVKRLVGGSVPACSPSQQCVTKWDQAA